MAGSRRSLTAALALVTLQGLLRSANGQTQIERNMDGRKTYQIEVPGRQPITIIESDNQAHLPKRWIDVSLDPTKDSVDLKEDDPNRYADVTVDHSRCFGPSCRENYQDGPDSSQTDRLEDFLQEYANKIHGLGGDAADRLQAISSLASKLKVDRYQSEDDDKSYPSSWNRLKVKQHKHPYDDNDGWVTLEAVPWSTSKVSKWKPNVKKHRPNHWDEDAYDEQPAPEQFKRPTKRPSFVNNQPHYDSDWDETPSKPSWAQQSASYPSAWSPDDSRRPHKPNCDSDSHRHPAEDASVYYGMTDSIVTDSRPTNFPYEYQPLKRPSHRPTQVVYAGFPEDQPRPTRPSSGDGQWVLLSTTKGYHKSKKRPRSMSSSDDDTPTMTSHHAVSLTVLPLEDGKKNMTTSHGGLLEVERSFKSVEESKRELDERKTVETGATPTRTALKKIARRVASAPGADGATVLAAVGAGMLPATMAMVVPMMLGKRRRRREVPPARQQLSPFYTYQ